MHRRNTFTLFLAFFLITCGITLLLLRNNIFDSIITKAFKLEPNSMIYEHWRIPPLQVKVDFYLFNWTNPDDIYNKSIKPHFEEIGPYTFNLHIEKVNITWNPNDTVTFKMFEEYYFDAENSVGKLTDVITTLNVVTAGAVHNLKNKGYFMKRGFSVSLAALSSNIHVTRTAGEFLFQGYDDPYIDLIRALPFLSDVSSPVDKAGFLYGRNSTPDNLGIYNIGTSQSERNLGNILNWNYQNKSSYYEGSCKKLKGSIGDFFHENQERDTIKFFLANACRNLVLDYEDDVVIHGINGYKFSALHSMLDNGTYAPENKCLCDGECLPVGTLNISACAYGSPSYLSLPHFYNADPIYLSNIEGLRPEKSKHEFQFTVEPRLGVCLDEAVRIQLNFLLQPVEYITPFENVPKLFVPILWSEQKTSVPQHFAIMMRVLLCLPTIIIPILSSILSLIGCGLLILQMYKSKTNFNFVSKINNSEFEGTPLREKGKDIIWYPTNEKNSELLRCD